MLHYLVDSTYVDINNMSSLFVMVKKARLKDRIQCTVPVLQDINGDTALDLALQDNEKQDMNKADIILKYIKDYPFMHSGYSLVSGINKAF